MVLTSFYGERCNRFQESVEIMCKYHDPFCALLLHKDEFYLFIYEFGVETSHGEMYFGIWLKMLRRIPFQSQFTPDSQ